MTFVEENIDSLNILKKNLLMLAIEKYTNVIEKKIELFRVLSVFEFSVLC